MTFPELPERDRKRIIAWNLHPLLLETYLKIQPAMTAFGAPVFLVYVGRTVAEQQALYAKGRTAPGRIVTYTDGVQKRSKHQLQTDGYVHAIDFAFMDDPRTPRDETWDTDMPWAVVGAMGEYAGLTWGGRWKMLDLGHLEIKA